MKYKIEKKLMVLVLLCLTQALIGASGESVVKTLYVDGVEVAEVTVDGNGLMWPNDYITIGSEGYSGGWLYNEYLGKVDDFAIYPGILSETRVAAHYDARTNYSTYSSVVTADVPKLWLKFDDSSKADGATAVNSGTVSTRNGTYVDTGDGSIATVAGFASGSNAVEFIGPRPADAPGQCVSVFDGDGDFGSLLEGDVSIELWVNYNDANDFPRFFQHNGNYEAYGSYGISVNDSNQIIMLGGGVRNYVSFENDLNDGAWHHIVITYDSTYNAPPETGTYAAEVAVDNPAYWLRFESEEPVDSAVNGANHWVGYGSAASIVSRAGGVGNSVLLDGTSGGAVYGVAITNNPDPPPLVEGSYAVYGDQYALVPGDITIEMWYKTLPPGQPQPGDFGLFFQQHGSYTHEPCAPAVSNCQGQIRVFGGVTAGYTGVSPKFDGEWHQMVVTYDENYLGDPARMFVQLYVDGVWKDDTDFTGARAVLGPEMSHMLFGAQNDIGNTYNLVPGYFDEIAIYDGLLSSERIQAHYIAWQPQTCEDMISRGYGSSVDFNQDCKINFTDFAEFAVNWMLCNDPEDENCLPNW